MKRCPITYDEIDTSEEYSARGLRLLDPQLTRLHPLPYTALEQRQEALARVDKISIQGVQLKLSAILNVKESRFEIVDREGNYILKPPSLDFAQLPENEDLTMKLASLIGIDVPFHGLAYGKEGALSYFIKRFDRTEESKLPVEDFAQLLGESRETKYNSSMEKAVSVIFQYTTNPAIESKKFFERTLFNFLTGNEDMHLKNFSLMTLHGKVMLAPAYDLINTTIVLKKPHEEIALPLAGKKSRLTKEDLLDYFAQKRLKLSKLTVDAIANDFIAVLPIWYTMIDRSFLTLENKTAYRSLLDQRVGRLLK